MDYKVAFFTETNYIGKFERSFENCRTDIAWMIALDATHYPIDIEIVGQEFDIGIVIFPKKGKTYEIEKFKQWCSKVGMMQEGPCNLWEDFSLDHQIQYFNSLQDADFILCHNQIDKLYFRGLVTESKCIETLPALMLEDSLDKSRITPREKRSGIIVGGNMCAWYGGFPSMVVANAINDTGGISIVSMGRKLPAEEHYFPDVKYIQYKIWNEWIYELSKYKYAVHLMPTRAAGTFALNCAYLGIPCIGYSGLDTQDVCHSTISVDPGNLIMACKFAETLYKNYEDCVWDSMMGYKRFNEESFTHNMNEKFKIISL